MQTQAVAPARWIKFQFGAVPTRAEIGGIAEPQGSPVIADEFAGEIEEITLLAKILQIGNDAPRPCEVIRL